MKVKARHLKDLANQPAKRGIRLIAIRLLQEAEDAFAKLETQQKAESLHDFRVALRRLRSHLQLYRPWLRKSVSRKRERRIKTIARSSNRSRDLEVLIERLDAIDEPNADARAGIDQLRREFKSELTPANARFRDHAVQHFPRLARRLLKGLSTYTATLHLEGPEDEPLGDVTDRLVTQQREELRQCLKLILSIEDQTEAHKARIAGKKLRSLFEPFAEESPDCANAVAALKTLQDLLGRMHDLDVLLTCVEAAIQAASPDDQAVLTAVHHRVAGLRAEAFRELEGCYLGTEAGSLIDSLQPAATWVTRVPDADAGDPQ